MEMKLEHPLDTCSLEAFLKFKIISQLTTKQMGNGIVS